MPSRAAVARPARARGARVAGGRDGPRADGPAHRRADGRRRGVLGLDVVRAARICSAGHGGQILLSDTTRALIGSDLPEGASVVDLGEAKLKDIQHERIYQLSLDDEHALVPAPEDRGRRSGKDAGDLLGERIERHVTERIERALTATEGSAAERAMKAAVGGCAIAVAVLVVALLALLALILLVKLAF